MILSYAYCNVPVMPLRSEPSHRSEQVSQLLFGEKAEVLAAHADEWMHVRCAADEYEGWCKAAQLQLIPFKSYRKAATCFSAHNSSRLITDLGEMWLPLGCDLLGMKRGSIELPGTLGVFKGKRLPFKKTAFNDEQVPYWAFKYLHAPYQWGGRSMAGIDCSGFTQMVYKLCGKGLPRDAKDQAQEGTSVDFLQDSRCGDLAFFDNAEGRITHVGILLHPNEIIHATDTAGRVVLDRIDTGGIISVTQKKRTHHLRLIRRYT
jgi:hypothetical protein